MSGFVSFVSAGPGDPELITVKGANRIRAADVILYDDLASGVILDYAQPNARLVAVGKRAGLPSTKQDHVNRLLIDYARTGNRIVRLKSGDAGIFGRLEEELTALREAQIGYEIVPGVTSGCAAAAASLIPLTRRETSRRVQFITGADTSGTLPADLNWPALADPKATTLVYMGKRTFPVLADRLAKEGLPGDTPALLAESIGTDKQRLQRSTVEELAAGLKGETATSPAIIMFGPLAPSE